MTTQVRLRIGGLVAMTCLTLIVVGGGCGGGAPSVTSSSEEATVHGTVKIKGKPASTGKVTFDPSNVSRRTAPVATGDIKKDSTYSVRTLVGANSVSVTTPETQKDPKLGYNTTSYDVKSGDNTYNIEILATSQ